MPPTVEPRTERIVTPIVPVIVPPAAAALTLAEVIERYLSDPTSARTAKSGMIYRTTYATIMEIIGADAPAASVNRETCREILDILRRLNGSAWRSGGRIISASCETVQRSFAPSSESDKLCWFYCMVIG